MLAQIWVMVVRVDLNVDRLLLYLDTLSMVAWCQNLGMLELAVVLGSY